MLESWANRRQPALEAAGIRVRVTRGPVDRTPAAMWVDFESKRMSARLILWSDGQAELTIGDLAQRDVVLDEHREISSDIGLDDVEATITAWFVEASRGGE